MGTIIGNGLVHAFVACLRLKIANKVHLKGYNSNNFERKRGPSNEVCALLPIVVPHKPL